MPKRIGWLANGFGDIASMRRQLLLIGTAAARELAEMLPPPQVIAFSGHMIDHPCATVAALSA